MEAETQLLTPDATVIYRDDHGAIIGGSDAETMDKFAVVPSGASYQELYVTHFPDGTDVSQTDIYVHERLE